MPCHTPPPMGTAAQLPATCHFSGTIRKPSPYQRPTKPHPLKKAGLLGKAKSRLHQLRAIRRPPEVPKERQAGDWNSLRTKDVTKLHSTHHICTKKKRLRAWQARVSYRRQACKACNDMKPELRRSNELPASFQGKALPLSIPKAEDKSRENQAYWLKPVKTKHLQIQTSLSSLHKASFYHPR